MYIPSSVALIIDTVATLLCQGGYVIQKKGHMSVEAHNTVTRNVDDKKSGFMTCTWFWGFALSLFAGFLHAGKFTIVRLNVIMG